MGDIELLVWEARDLISADSNGKSDPYAIVSIVTANDYASHKKGKIKKSKTKTKVISENLDPVWNQTFHLKASQATDVILIDVMDHDKIGKDDPLGFIGIPCSSLPPETPVDMWLDLKDTSHGSIRVVATYKPKDVESFKKQFNYAPIHQNQQYTPQEQQFYDRFSEIQTNEVVSMGAAPPMPAPTAMPQPQTHQFQHPPEQAQQHPFQHPPGQMPLGQMPPGQAQPHPFQQPPGQMPPGHTQSQQHFQQTPMSQSGYPPGYDQPPMQYNSQPGQPVPMNHYQSNGPPPHYQTAPPMDHGNPMQFEQPNQNMFYTTQPMPVLQQPTVTTTTYSFMPMPTQWTAPTVGASLKVRIAEAQKLIVADLTSSDPYAIIYCNDAHAKSSVKKRTLNPKWNETFTLRPNGVPQFLVISLLDHDAVGKDDPLGCVVIPLDDLIQGIEKSWWCPLQGVKRGSIFIGILAENFGYPPGSFAGYNPITLLPGFYPNRPHRGPIPKGYGIKRKHGTTFLYCKWEATKKKHKKNAKKVAKVAGKAALYGLAIAAGVALGSI